MRDILDDLIREIRREKRIANRAKREARARERSKIPHPPEPQGKPERWTPTVPVLLMHTSGVAIGIFTELHHEVHKDWRRFQPAPEGTSAHHTEIVSGTCWFQKEPVEHIETELETIALRERFLELLNAAETEYNPWAQIEHSDPGGSEGETGSLPILPD
jgi:hypothetical protein